MSYTVGNLYRSKIRDKAICVAFLINKQLLLVNHSFLTMNLTVYHTIDSEFSGKSNS